MGNDTKYKRVVIVSYPQKNVIKKPRYFEKYRSLSEASGRRDSNPRP